MIKVAIPVTRALWQPWTSRESKCWEPKQPQDWENWAKQPHLRPLCLPEETRVSIIKPVVPPALQLVRFLAALASWKVYELPIFIFHPTFEKDAFALDDWLLAKLF